MNRSIVVSGGAKLLGCALVLAAAACADKSTGPNLNADDAVIFLALNEPPNGVMEALYQGVVAADANGCLRLDGGETVIWPYGATLVERAGKLYVKDANGRDAGRVGGAFDMGGGYVPSLDFALLSPQDRARAETTCASAYYWIAGELVYDRAD